MHRLALGALCHQINKIAATVAVWMSYCTVWCSVLYDAGAYLQTIEFNTSPGS